MIAISLISVTLLLILAAIAAYLSVKNLLRWKEIEMDTARARVFLDKSFLNANFKLILAAVGLVFIHFIMIVYACRNEYDKKLEKIRSAKWRYIDETGFKVNGKKWWLWIFRTNDGDSLVVIRKSRGREVIDEIMGKKHRGPDIADGWRAYDSHTSAMLVTPLTRS